MLQPSIASATNIDTLLAGQLKENIPPPPESVQDKIFFIFNNLSLANMNQKVSHLYIQNILYIDVPLFANLTACTKLK